MNKELEIELVKKYPKILQDYKGDPMKTCMAWGMEFDDGWKDLIDKCLHKLQYFCDLVSSKGEPMQVVAAQLKEKYGTLSFYFNGEGGKREDWDIIDDIITQTERRSAQVCEVSGEYGELCHRGGWYKTLCYEEARKLGYEACDESTEAYWKEKAQINKKNITMMSQKEIEELEEQAFYESGLSADGCLQKLDSYEKESIKRYGRYLLQKQKEETELLKEDLRKADYKYIELIKQVTTLEEENKNIKQRLSDIKEGFEGCCYACEPVDMVNQKLEEQLKAIEEDETKEHNAAFVLRRRLADSLVQNDQCKDVAKKLYGVVSHLQEVSKRNSVVVVGSAFYSEAVYAIKEYEKLYGN